MPFLITGSKRIFACVSHHLRKHTALSSQENDSVPLWPLDRACHHYALVTLCKYSLLASLTASHLPNQYYISMYMYIHSELHPILFKRCPESIAFENSYFRRLMLCSQQALIKPTRSSGGRQWTMAYSRDRVTKV